MAYHLEGRLLEVCNCKVLCPCWIGEDPDFGTCDTIVAWHFDKGKIEGVDVAGTTIALIAHVPAATLRRAIPIALEKLGPFTEPEPSEGATIELASGRHVVVIFGLVTERLYVHAANPDGVAAVADFLRESRIGEASIEWLDPRFAAVTAAAGQQLTPVRT